MVSEIEKTNSEIAMLHIFTDMSPREQEGIIISLLIELLESRKWDFADLNGVYGMGDEMKEIEIKARSLSSKN